MLLLIFCIGFYCVRNESKKNRIPALIHLDVGLFFFYIGSRSHLVFFGVAVFCFALFIYFSYPFSDKLANISGCIKNNKCPENESKSFVFAIRFSSSLNDF